MFSKLRGHMRHNVVAYLALFVAFGGTSAWATHETILSSDIVDGEVKTVDLGTAAVTAPKLGTAAVTNAKLATAAVTDVKLGTSAVTAPKIATSAVTNAKLGAASVTNAKLAAGAVTPAKFGVIPAARATKTGAQSVPDSTNTVLTFESESFDTAGLHSTTSGTETLTAPISGLYQVSAGVDWSDNSTGNRVLLIGAGPPSGQDIVASSTTKGSSHATFPTLQSASSLVKLAAGDLVFVVVDQDSGGSQSVSAGDDTSLTMHWVGPG